MAINKEQAGGSKREEQEPLAQHPAASQWWLRFGNRSNEGSCWLGVMSGNIVRVNLRMIVRVDSPSGAGFEADDAEYDAQQREDFDGRSRFCEEDHAEDRRPRRSDAGPDRVAGAYGNGLQGLREKAEACRHGQEGTRRRPEPGESFGIFQPDRPADFEQSGYKQERPRHSFIRIQMCGIGLEALAKVKSCR